MWRRLFVVRFGRYTDRKWPVQQTACVVDVCVADLRAATHPTDSSVNCLCTYVHACVKSRTRFHVPAVPKTGTCRSSGCFIRLASLVECIQLVIAIWINKSRAKCHAFRRKRFAMKIQMGFTVRVKREAFDVVCKRKIWKIYTSHHGFFVFSFCEYYLYVINGLRIFMQIIALHFCETYDFFLKCFLFIQKIILCYLIIILYSIVFNVICGNNVWCADPVSADKYYHR